MNGTGGLEEAPVPLPRARQDSRAYTNALRASKAIRPSPGRLYVPVGFGVGQPSSVAPVTVRGSAVTR